MTSKRAPTIRRPIRLRRLACWFYVILGVFAVSAIAAPVQGQMQARTRTLVRSPKNPIFGRILTNAKGYTLYVFCTDGNKQCTGGGAAPGRHPLIAHGAIVAGKMVNQHELGRKRLPSGESQVTYYGQPLYLFSRDKHPGESKGEFWGYGGSGWWVVKDDGQPIPITIY